MMPLYIYLFLLIELLAVAYVDFRDKRISNMWSILNICIFILLLFLRADLYPLSWNLLFYPGIFLILGFVLFLIKIMGAGDAKYLATFYLLIPLANRELSIETLIGSTIVVGGLFLIYNLIKNIKMVVAGLRLRDLKMLGSCFGTRFAYAPVILLSWIWLGIEIRDSLLQ